MPATASPRREDIQGLRAAAVLLVVAYHAGLGLDGGFVGVDVFFVISGYVITGTLLRELDAFDRIDLRRFALRRVRRLLPAFSVMLAVVLLSGGLFSPAGGQQVAARTGVAATLFNANTYLTSLERGYFDTTIELNALLHTWSLSVEEQFYAVFPLLTIGLWRLARGRVSPRAFLTGGFATIAIASLAGAVLLVEHSDRGGTLAFYLAPTRAWEFLAGALLAVRPDLIVRAVSRRDTVLGASGLLLIIWASIAYDDATPFPGAAALVPVLGTAMVIAAGEAGGQSRLMHTLRSTTLGWIGDRSYGWYLWHWPAIVYARAAFPNSAAAPVIAAVASLGAAEASFRFVEQPTRQRVPARVGGTLRLAAICIAIPLVAAASLDAAQRQFDASDRLAPFVGHADQTLGCDSEVPLGDRGSDTCEWPADDPQGLAVLIGDSQAGQLIEGFTGAMQEISFTAIAASNSGCPFADVAVVRNGQRSSDPACRLFVERSTEHLLELRPDAVIIASATDLYLRNDTTIADPSTSSVHSDALTADEAVWADGLQRTIETLSSAGIDVTVIHPIPKFPGWEPEACATFLWLLSPNRCTRSMPAAQMDEMVRPAREVEAVAVRKAGARSLDPFEELCSHVCATTGPDGWIMRDGGHLTVRASDALSPWIQRAFVPPETDSAQPPDA